MNSSTDQKVNIGIRLFIFDCGVIDGVTSAEFGFDEGTLSSRMATPCYLIVHPKGILIWDTGEIPDNEIVEDGKETQKRSFSASKRLRDQLSEIGYTPEDIDLLALSHYHNDHVANAHLFTGATWLVQRAEYEAMFDANPDFERFGPITPDQQYFYKLRESKKIVIENCDHDVFDDGTVVIKFTPGHTAGHQSLFVDLPDTGPIVITGDLYHYYEEVNREASFVNHVSNPVTTQSRRKIKDFTEETGAEIWIPHDINRNAMLNKSPDFYS